MRTFIERYFQIDSHQTTFRTEVMAGLTSFVTVVYIVAVNAAILSDAGIPLAAGILATVLTSLVGCLMMGLWANAPVVLVPGMGVNALFTYTIVHSMGLSWQEALAAVFVAGSIFALTAFTRLARTLSAAIPNSLKEAITVGIGIFLTFIGLQKGGLVASSPSTFVALGHLSDPQVIATLLSLIVALVLFVRQVKANFLISITIGTLLAIPLGLVDLSAAGQADLSPAVYMDVLGALSFERLASMTFWVATFSLAMVLVFENMGLLAGMLPGDKFKRSYQANAVSAITAGLFGTSPTVSTVESAAGIAAGGKTGLTSITTGLLFLLSLFFLPVIRLIPDSAIAPVLIIIGGLMIQNIKNISFDDFAEGFPAFLIIVLIPLTYSIADGIAFGFIAYPLLKLALGRPRDVAAPLYVISGLFLLNFVLHAA